jgi:hypothetical protein
MALAKPQLSPRLPPLTEPAPFTVTARVDGLPVAFPAASASIAAAVARDGFPANATDRYWGPTASEDGQPWPVSVFIRCTTVDDDHGPLHLALLRAGYAVPDRIAPCCPSALIEMATADFSGRGQPCDRCLRHWQAAFNVDDADNAFLTALRGCQGVASARFPP